MESSIWPENFQDLLISRLENKLPGIDAHQYLAPYPNRLLEQPDDEVRNAAVCIVLIRKGNDFVFPVLQRQSSNPKDPHRGQIGLPGGRFEPLDIELYQTAIRETEEEIGISQNQLIKIGQLSPLYVPVSKNIIYPYITFAKTDAAYILQHDEVESIHEISLHQLTNSPISNKKINASYELSRNVPGFEFPPYFIWGATSMILHEFRMIIKEICDSIPVR